MGGGIGRGKREEGEGGNTFFCHGWLWMGKEEEEKGEDERHGGNGDGSKVGLAGGAVAAADG